MCQCNKTEGRNASLEGTSETDSSNDDHNHAKPEGAGNFDFHIDLAAVGPTRGLDPKQVRVERSLKEDIGRKGDLLDPGGGRNTVIGSGDSDIILGTGGGFNTITTGTGKDVVILGKETTNRIFDFDPSRDRLGFSSDVDINNIVIAQGKNPGKGALDQPLDSITSTLIIDKSTNHILASLSFVDASALSTGNFRTIDAGALGTLDKTKFNTQEGSGQLNGTRNRDKLVGGSGDDFLYVGNDGFKIKQAKGIDEFPFPTDSPGSTKVDATLKDGVLKINGTWKDFDGLPLFSQDGVDEKIDPTATILNGADPDKFTQGFISVPEDVEGNPITGAHLHFSPSGDKRGNFADATVVRFVETEVNADFKSGTLRGEFELSPEEQAAFLAGNIYLNIHTNIDGDKDGKGGFPTGENRINFNQNVVKFR
ncbi:CHRD domain-containing protein [Oculatella sp. LEGE 06141]|nr:CHRD domain-containing protein [Oculatella sp. LEGE 06141]